MVRRSLLYNDSLAVMESISFNYFTSPLTYFIQLEGKLVDVV